MNMEVKLNLLLYKSSIVMAALSSSRKIFLKSDVKKRLSYLFGDKKSIDCDTFKGHEEHISKFINCILKKPLLSERIFNNYSEEGKGNFGTVIKSDITIEELKENYTVVLKDNVNHIEDINEIFINQVRINPEIIFNNNPNFPILISYILCHPIPSFNFDKLCQDSIVDIEKYTIDELTQLLKRNVIKLYGIYEYINGKTLLRYISTIKFMRMTDIEKWNFLKSVLIQVFSSLQSLTNSGNYTHYDLHLGNIMISEKPLNYAYTLTHDSIVKVKDSFRCFIIDQGLSNIEYEGDIFMYENNSLNRPFLHSFDIFKLITKLYIALATDNISINSLYCKKLRSLLKILFNDPTNPDIDFVMSYITSNPNSKNGDVTLYYNSLIMKNEKDKAICEPIYQAILEMTYNDLVQTLLIEKDILDISKEENISFQAFQVPSEKRERKPIPIIIKGRK